MRARSKVRKRAFYRSVRFVRVIILFRGAAVKRPGRQQVETAEADAQAKVIDSKAELERRNMLADAEANRIKVVAVADAERMTSEAALLNKSPLLINKIVAERLSDKIQVVMVPSDGKFFFASDVFKSAGTNPVVKQEMESEQQDSGPSTGH